MSGFDNNDSTGRTQGGYNDNDRFTDPAITQGQGGRAGRGMGMGNDDFTDTGLGGGNTDSSNVGNFPRGDQFGSTGRPGDAFNDASNPTDSGLGTRGGGYNDGLNADSNAASLGAGVGGTQGEFGASGGHHHHHHQAGLGDSRFDDTTGSGVPGGGYKDATSTTSGGYGGTTDTGYGDNTSTGNTYGGDDPNFNQGQGGAKPSMGQKIKGTIDETLGKMTNNPTKVERGQEMKSGGQAQAYNTQRDYNQA